MSTTATAHALYARPVGTPLATCALPLGAIHLLTYGVCILCQDPRVRAVSSVASILPYIRGTTSMMVNEASPVFTSSVLPLGFKYVSGGKRTSASLGAPLGQHMNTSTAVLRIDDDGVPPILKRDVARP